MPDAPIYDPATVRVLVNDQIHDTRQRDWYAALCHAEAFGSALLVSVVQTSYGCVVALANFGRAMQYPIHDQITWDYVSEKLDISRPDAIAVIEIVKRARAGWSL